MYIYSVTSGFNEGPGDWQNLFSLSMFRYIKVLFHTCYFYWGKENCSLYRGLRYVEFVISRYTVVGHAISTFMN